MNLLKIRKKRTNQCSVLLKISSTFHFQNQFHSSLVHKKMQFCFYFLPLICGFKLIEIGLCVETHTESGKIFAFICAQQIIVDILYVQCNAPMMMMMLLLLFRWAFRVLDWIAIYYTIIYGMHNQHNAVLCIYYYYCTIRCCNSFWQIVYAVLLIKTICRFSEQLPMDALLSIYQ